MKKTNRTIVYVDGFNLYYSIRGVPNSKWLDLLSLFADVLRAQSKITKIKYFTADVAGRDGDNSQADRQKIYLQALQSHLGSFIEIVKGDFQTSKPIMPRAFDTAERVRVKKTEEKGSDVNLAVHLLNDAWNDDFDCGFVVSNDSDLAEAVRLVTTQFPQKTIGIGTASKNHSKRLFTHATFTKKIGKSKLQKNQLPEVLKNANGKTIEKPEIW